VTGNGRPTAGLINRDPRQGRFDVVGAILGHSVNPPTPRNMASLLTVVVPPLLSVHLRRRDYPNRRCDGELEDRGSEKQLDGEGP